MDISKEQVRHIARLARLRLSDAEESKFAVQLSSILTFVQKLNEVDTSDVSPLAQVTNLENVYREDLVVACDETIRQGILAQFNERKGDFLHVQEVFSDSE